jgi:hypothetical protein
MLAYEHATPTRIEPSQQPRLIWLNIHILNAVHIVFFSGQWAQRDAFMKRNTETAVGQLGQTASLTRASNTHMLHHRREDLGASGLIGMCRSEQRRGAFVR